MLTSDMMLLFISICLCIQVQSLRVIHSHSLVPFRSIHNSVTTCYASVESKETGLNIDTAIDKLRVFTASSTYSAIEAAVVFGLASAIDGGYSGDWSRYGLISKGLEDTIKDGVIDVGLFHIICGIVAAGFAKYRQLPIAPSTLHTLLIGGLGLFRVVLQTDETALRFPTVYQAKQSLANLFAGNYDAVAVNKQIDDLISSNPCVIFSFTTCPYCIKAKDLLINQLGATVEVLELDKDKAIGYPIRAELGKRTGRTSVPSIWIDGQFIGGCDDGPSTVTVPTTITTTISTSKPSSSEAIKIDIDYFTKLMQSFLNKDKDEGGTRPKTTITTKTTVASVTTQSGKGGVKALYEEGILQQLLKEAKAI